MTKKNRFIILCMCATLFLVVAPCLVFYSMGYRFDFATMKIVSTGGIYVRVVPQRVDILIDSKIDNKTGIFSNDVFVQNLLPREHTVLIKKEGYYDYQKSILVEKNQVTKLENVILFKNNTSFQVLTQNADYFSLAPDNTNLITAVKEKNKVNFTLINLQNNQEKTFSLTVLNPKIIDLQWSSDSQKVLAHIDTTAYFLLNTSLQTPTITPLEGAINVKEVTFNPENSSEFFFIKNKVLYSNKQELPLLKNVITYQTVNQTIEWLSGDGLVYRFNMQDKTSTPISNQVFPIKKNATYKIVSLSSAELFLQENQTYFLLNEKSKIFEIFYTPLSGLKLSPDGKKILYFNNTEIGYYIINTQEKVSLGTFPGPIVSSYWLNDDYVIFQSKDSIMISEIDARGNINIVNLPSIIAIDTDTNIDIKNPIISFNQQDKKVYILTQGYLLSSERLIP